MNDFKSSKKSREYELERKPFVRIGPIEITLPHGFYGGICFLVLASFLAFFTDYNQWGIIGFSAVLSSLFAGLTYKWARNIFYRIIRNQIPLTKTIKINLLSKLSGHEKEIEDAIKILDDTYINQKFVPAFIRPKLEELAYWMAEAYGLPNGGWYRVININYLEFTFRNTNIWHYLSANIKSSPIDILNETLKNIVEFQKIRPRASHISIRDIYAGVISSYCSKDAKAVSNYYDDLAEEKRVNLHDHLNEQDKVAYLEWIEGRTKRRIFSFNSSILNKLTTKDTQNLLNIAFDIKKYAKKIVTHIITSETHVVLSAITKIEDGTTIMMISATNTNKNNLLVLSQTPIVWKDMDTWYYLCDESHYPSSESLTHWTLHKELKKENRPEYPFIVHCHPVDVLDYVKPKNKEPRDINFSSGKIKTLGWAKHGTEEFGHYISFAMASNGVTAGVVEGHGIWVAGKSFDEATELMINIVTYTSNDY